MSQKVSSIVAVPGEMDDPCAGHPSHGSTQDRDSLYKAVAGQNR
jgi:hypothetical protein